MFILYAALHSIFVLPISFHLLDVFFIFFSLFIYLQACAPRYVFHGTQPRKVVRVEPVGTCYLAKNNFTTYTEYSPCRTSKYNARNACTSARKYTNKNNCTHVDARRDSKQRRYEKGTTQMQSSNSNCAISFFLCVNSCIATRYDDIVYNVLSLVRYSGAHIRQKGTKCVQHNAIWNVKLNKKEKENVIVVWVLAYLLLHAPNADDF